MQTYKTIPQEEVQKKFFARYGKYAPYIAVGVILAQMLSGLTESGLIFTNVKDATQVFGMTTANISGVIGALVGVALIEIVGLRIALPGVVDAILYKRWSGLDLAFSIVLIVLTLALLPSSTMLSLKGGGQIVDNMKEKKHSNESEAINAELKQITDSLATAYTTKKEEIKTTYGDLINSEESAATAKLEVAQQNYKHWKSKGSRYKTKINNALVEVKQVEADKTAKVMALKEQQITALNDAEKDYTRAKNAAIDKANSKEHDTSDNIEQKSAVFKTGTKFIVMIAMFFAVCGITLDRIFKKGSGIEELAEPNNFYFAPSLLSEKMKLIQDGFQIDRRNKIASKRGNLPQVMPYASTLPIHDMALLERTILQLKMSEGEQKQILYLNTPQVQQQTATGDLEHTIKSLTDAQIQLEEKNQHEAAKVIELQAKQVIKLYLERNNQNTNDKEINSFQTKVISHLNEPEKVPNPFDENKQRTIGFKQNDSDTVNGMYGQRREQKTDINAKSKTNTKQCQHCGKELHGVHWNQKYCNDNNDACRIAAWEIRNGRNFRKRGKK